MLIYSRFVPNCYFVFLDGEVAGRAKCEGDFESGAYWTNIRVFKTCGDDKISEDTDSHEDDDPTVLEQSSVKERLKELAEVLVPLTRFILKYSIINDKKIKLYNDAMYFLV